jgi:protein phosphatase 1 regulatory subunit 7
LIFVDCFRFQSSSEFICFRYLDVSFNQIRDLGGLGQSCSLQELYVVCNKISEICGLESLVNLRLLELGSNRIRVCRQLSQLQVFESVHVCDCWYFCSFQNISGLSGLRSLEELWLGRNKIERIEVFWLMSFCWFVGSFFEIFNMLFECQGFCCLVNLRKLSLQSNRLTDIGSGLSCCASLQELYLSHNGIIKICGLESLVCLADIISFQ